MDKIVGGILGIVALYVLFIYNDGALFTEFSGRLGAWFADQMLEDRSQ